MDFEAGLKRYGTEDIYIKVLQSYVTHSPELLDKLRTLTRETLPDYAITVHGIKGSSYGVCANETGKNAEELEHAAKAGDYETVSARNAAFIEKAEALLEDLRKLLEKVAGTGEGKQKAPAPDRELLEKLLDASKHYKSAIMEDLVTELESWEYESGGELIPWLREQLDNLEYDAIGEKLESLI
jgi:hypothetical protein